MDAVVPAAAPAQPTETSPPTAVDHAVSSRDFAAYRDAKRAEASGTPLPAPEPAAAATPAPARAVSKRQQDINDHIRRATEAELEATRLREENARLKAGAAAAQPPAMPAPVTPPAAGAQPAAAGDPEPTPDQFDSYDKFVKAQARWEARQQISARDQEAQTRAAADRQAQTEHARATKFSESIQAATTADPQFLQTLTPDVLALKPFNALKAGEAGGPLNVLAEELLDSPVAPQVMRHLSDHPEELQRFTTLRSARDVVRAFNRLEARYEATSAAASTHQPRTVPAAPAPPPTLGTRAADAGDPVDGAVKRRDFQAFRAAKAAQRARR